MGHHSISQECADISNIVIEYKLYLQANQPFALTRPSVETNNIIIYELYHWMNVVVECTITVVEYRSQRWRLGGNEDEYKYCVL